MSGSDLVRCICRIRRIRRIRHWVAAGALVLLPACGLAVSSPLDDSARVLARAVAKKDWPAATDAARMAFKLRPDSALAAYNLACMLSRSGELDEAVTLLGRSADLGFSYLSTLLRDEDLDAVRSRPGYAAAYEAVKRNNAAELEKAKPALDSVPLVTVEPKKKSSNEKESAVSAPTPLVVVLHGYGGTPEPLAEAFRGPAARLGAILVAPRGQEKVGEGFGWGVVEQAEYLVLKAIDRTVAAHPEAASSPIVLAGFSQGGGVALTLAARYPARFAGVVSIAGYYEDRLNPLPSADQIAFVRYPRISFLIGELDDSIANNRSSAARLRESGVAVRERYFPGLGHAFPPSQVREREIESALRFALEGKDSGEQAAR
ncbi:MAG: alpha/beta fold hydrolase [Thermoanaerobaculia bacterium]